MPDALGWPSKSALATSGSAVMAGFCNLNSLPIPHINDVPTERWKFGTCAYYRRGAITICLPRCAGVGVAGRAWSFPGYTVDRTPYGVLQHELGHHADVLRGATPRPYSSEFSTKVREASGEKPISSYCPDDAEWFAEMFRVFVTNPDLLRLVRPRTHRALSTTFTPLFTDSWRERLAAAPARTLAAAERKIEEARQ